MVGPGFPADQARPLILLVDDDPLALGFIASVVSAASFDAIAATDPAQALVQAAGRSIALVVSDVEMPSMRGPELVATLRRLQPDLGAIFISGCDLHDDLPDGAALLVKPFDPRDLVRLIEHELNARRDR